MDYQRIYSAFIASRKRIEDDLQGYTERHHILPRSLGGTDDPENLIRLTPEDHFFAHLLLAKATNEAKAWAACLILAGAGKNGRRPKEVRRALVRHRKVFGLVRRAWNKTSRGESAANADLEEYTFYHHDGREFQGTRIAFSEAYGVAATSINQMIQGRSGSCFGWALTREQASTLVEMKALRSKRAGKALKGFVRRPDLYCFYNEAEGRSIIATQKGMKSLGLLDRSGVSALCSGGRFSAKGWCLIDNAEWAFDRSNRRGKYCGAYSDKAYHFVNDISGEETTGTIWEMGQRYGDGDSRPFGDVVGGRRRGFRGWHLQGQAAPRVQNLVRVFVHPKTGQQVSGTILQVSHALGVTRTAVDRHVRGVAPHVKGFKMVGLA